MAETMKAAVVREFGKPLSIEDVPIPKPGRDQALVKVRSSGVCHTDLHAAKGDWPVKPTLPFVPGHEGYGEVVEVGEGVTELTVGDLVGNAWLWSTCLECRYCRTGWETLATGSCRSTTSEQWPLSTPSDRCWRAAPIPGRSRWPPTPRPPSPTTPHTSLSSASPVRRRVSISTSRW